MYASDPTSSATATTGGTIAINVGGVRCLRQSVLAGNVIALQVALTDRRRLLALQLWSRCKTFAYFLSIARGLAFGASVDDQLLTVRRNSFADIESVTPPLA